MATDSWFGQLRAYRRSIRSAHITHLPTNGLLAKTRVSLAGNSQPGGEKPVTRRKKEIEKEETKRKEACHNFNKRIVN
jgi:hypothetical protein